MKTVIEFNTYGQSAEEMLSKAIHTDGTILSKNAILFHAAPENTFLNGVFKSKKAALMTVKKLELMLERAKGVCDATGQSGHWVGFEIKKA